MKNPAWYLGRHKHRRYFEGWYFKCISADQRQALAIIPGIAADPAGKKHAFIQVINAVSGKTWYFNFPSTDFWAPRDQFAVRIADNTFGPDGVEVDVESKEGRFRGRLAFSQIHAFPVSRFNPSIMGPFAFIPFMECYHAIIHLSHTLHGQLELDGEILDFDEGTGYIEKDYGRSFPKTYLWLQASHFDQGDASFVFSRAAIPLMGRTFDGFFAYFTDFGERSLRFATYNHSRLDDWQVDAAAGTCSGRISGPAGLLEFSAQMEGGGRLRAPVEGLMDRVITESITASVSLSLTASDGRLIYRGTSQKAGMEISI